MSPLACVQNQLHMVVVYKWYMETLHITYIDATWQLNSPGAAILLTKSYATLLIEVKLTTNPPTPSTYVGLFQLLLHPKSCPSYFPDSIHKQEILDNITWETITCPHMGQLLWLASQSQSHFFTCPISYAYFWAQTPDAVLHCLKPKLHPNY
jgi:hypothetical protein